MTKFTAEKDGELILGIHHDLGWHDDHWMEEVFIGEHTLLIELGGERASSKERLDNLRKALLDAGYKFIAPHQNDDHGLVGRA